ncbi:MAG: Fur family transcriptional regulator [bacterium]
MENIIERLKRKGVVLTPQRLAVAEFLEGNFNYPSVDEIYTGLKKSYPTISLATIYNSLEALKEAGEIQELTIKKDKVCFDPDPKPHHHFFCNKCKKVIDINISCATAEKGHIYGNRIEEVQAYFYGTCKNCVEKEEKHKKGGAGK